jgi:DNA-binding beta-propeller fold protein YncE
MLARVIGIRVRRASMLALAIASGMAAGPACAGAVTVTIGRQSLATFNDYFHCSACTNTVLPYTLTTPGDMTQAPADGEVVRWRVVGACTGSTNCDHILRVLRFTGGQYTYEGSNDVFTVATCDRCAPLDGSDITISPPLPIAAGDYVGLTEGAANNADARVMVVSATGATYAIFAGYTADGSSASPVASGSNYEALFNADVVLDVPVVSAVAPSTGATAGGQRVTITGDHLAGASQVMFGTSPAIDFWQVSNTEITAVAPPHAAGAVDVTVTAPGGTSAPNGGDAFTFLSPAATGGAGGTAYVGTHDAQVWQYAVTGGGLLSPMSPASASGAGSAAVAISPDGRSVYVLDATPNNRVFQYDVGADGGLTPKPQPTVETGPIPTGIAVSPDGRSVYVADDGSTDGSAGITQYDVGPDGSLTPKVPALVASAPHPSGVAVNPDGHSVYVTSISNSVISQYDVGTGGLLTPKAPPTVSAAGDNARGIAVSPDGHSMYATNFGSSNVSEFDVDAAGHVTLKLPSYVAAGAGPWGIAISPDGRSVYVTDETAGDVAQYDVGATGQLTPKTPPTVPAGTKPNGVAVSPDGRSVYVADHDSGEVSQYDVAADGSLTPKAAQASVGSGLYPSGIALLPDQGPVAGFHATAGAAGSPTTFDASSSHDPDGAVTRFDWDFGDGSQAANGGATPAHTYAAPGSYTVTLTVTDGADCSTSFVFSGQTASCNGGPAARATQTVVVPAHTTATPPAKAIIALSSIQVARNGAFALTFTATPGLKGRAVLRSLRKVRVSRRSKVRRRVTLARRSFTVPPGGKVRLKLKLSAKGLRILKLNRRIRARVTITLTNAAGLSSTTTTIVTLKAPKPRH